ncbi:hypothetical protein ACMHYJ_05255 [Castellaniella hirudinis]|uniref:hypothetical protein n=1 Tax=Castellaniella hirudinis TaxID=1144617 RepID=UPI0039C08726
MITKERMKYEANRAFALAELIDTTYTIAFNCLNEGGDHEGELQRVKELLFAAHEVASSAANDLSDLFGECETSQANDAGLAEVQS